MKLVLFDIDGTLITRPKKSNGFSAHKYAFHKAIKDVYKIEANIEEIEYPGMTDGQIIHQLLLLKKDKISEEIIFSQEKLNLCFYLMEKYYKENMHKDPFCVIKGADTLVQELHKRDIHLGIVTGNLEKIACAKLSRISLKNYFPIGGYGSDSRIRHKLIDIALERAKKHFLQDDYEDIWVIGDTPRDVEAAQKAGVKVISVATGKYSEDLLQKASPDALFKDYSNIKKFIEIITA